MQVSKVGCSLIYLIVSRQRISFGELQSLDKDSVDCFKGDSPFAVLIFYNNICTTSPSSTQSCFNKSLSGWRGSCIRLIQFGESARGN